MNNVLSSIVAVNKTTQKELSEQTKLLQALLAGQNNIAAIEKKRAQEEKRAQRKTKRAAGDRNILGDILGSKADKKKSAKSLFDTIGNIIGTVIGGLGALGLAKALGLTAIGGLITTYFASPAFQNMVNGLVKSLFDTIGNGMRDLADRVGQAVLPQFNPRLNNQKASAQAPITDNDVKAIRDNLLQQAKGAKGAELEALKTQAAKLKEVTNLMDQISFNQRAADENEKKQNQISTQIADLELNGNWLSQLQLPGLRRQLEQLEQADPQIDIKLETAENELAGTLKGDLLDLLNEELEKKHKADGKTGTFTPYTIDDFGNNAKQTGGPIRVPGSSTGDRHPYMLPEGSFIMNRNAVSMLQSGGMVPTLLESGENIYGPGQWDASHMMMNNLFSRFQTGGKVDAEETYIKPTSQRLIPTSQASVARDPNSISPASPSGETETQEESTKGKTGAKAIIDAAKEATGMLAGESNMCARTVRNVLRKAGHPAADKTTKLGDLDVPKGYSVDKPGGGPDLAGSFGGSDMGTVYTAGGNAPPGSVIMWRGSDPKYGPEEITHVGLRGDGDDIYHHGTAPGWRKDSNSKKPFDLAVDLNGTASGNSGSNSGNSGGASNMHPVLAGFAKLAHLFNPFAKIGTQKEGNNGNGDSSTSGDSGSYSESGDGSAPGAAASKAHLKKAMDELNYQGDRAALMAIAKHESAHWKKLREVGVKDATRANQVWPSLPVAEAQALLDKGGPKALYDDVYGPVGNPGLGNGPGEGWKYRGRGYIQITGKDNYTKVGKRIGKDIVSNPALLEDPYLGALSSVAYMQLRGSPASMETALTAVGGSKEYWPDKRATYQNYKANGFQKGGAVNMRGAGSMAGNSLVKESQKQFAKQIAEASSPIIIPVPTGGGHDAESNDGGRGPSTNFPYLKSEDSSIVSMEYKYRITMGASV